ncbi:MAG: hypothetical protein METHAR1v1_420010 [Methanothrix sp.]|jgi:hypothetical protein|nr:MAG: hypothetical protein METHAR1v1_420010 [Methanothrix sp.]
MAPPKKGLQKSHRRRRSRLLKRLAGRDRFKWSLASHSVYMYEDLSEIYQAALEDERKRKYMKEIGDWLVEEYFEPYQAS